MKWFEEAMDIFEALLILFVWFVFVFYITRELIV